MERNKTNFKTLENKKSIRIAVVGCLHGNLKEVYDEIESNELQTGRKVDLLLCCGDFQSMRNKEDLKYISCPDKYKQMGQFQYYYNSNNPAPYLTIFIGGNHEASNVLNNNFYGGWICKNIFYLGRAGVIKYKGIRIAGLSGIYKKFDYFKGHFENDLLKDIKSIYHTREFEIAKLSHLSGNLDILMTHDWPTGSVNPKDIIKILKFKNFWREELMTDTLGSRASGFLLKLLKPKYFLAGHMHYTYFNKIKHEIRNDGVNINITQFIALDKAGTKRKREFLHIFDHFIENLSDEDYLNDDIYFDEEWLAITKYFNQYFPLENKNYLFSDFVKNKSEYLNYIWDNYNFHFRYHTQNSNVSQSDEKEDLSNTIKIYTDDFKLIKRERDLKWQFLTGIEQREYIVNLIGMEDFHRININSNISRINYKNSNTNFKQNESYTNNTDNKINNDNNENTENTKTIKLIPETTTLTNPNIKNTEEINIDFEF